MKILAHVDLGKAFESLKNTLIEVEMEAKKDTHNVLDTGMKYASALGRLSAAVTWHIASNTDTSFDFLDKALKMPENDYSEAPTLLLHEQLNWHEEKNI